MGTARNNLRCPWAISLTTVPVASCRNLDRMAINMTSRRRETFLYSSLFTHPSPSRARRCAYSALSYKAVFHFPSTFFCEYSSSFAMARLSAFSLFIIYPLILALLPSVLAGPACAKRNAGSESCVAKCGSKWGWSGRAMGNDPWGQVMTVTLTDMGSVVTKACRVRPS